MKLRSEIKRGWELIAVTSRNWWDDDPFRLASSLAFYTVFSLAPILLISVALASIVFSETEAKKQVVQQVRLLIGSEGAVVVRQVLDNLAEIGGGLKAIVFGIIAVLIGSTAVFVNLQSALNNIWNVKPAPKRSLIKEFIQSRIRSFGIVLAVGFLLLVSMEISALISGFRTWATQLNTSLSWMWQFTSAFIMFIITAFLFAMIYKYLPDVKIRWSDVFIGGFITSALFSTGKYLIGLYLGSRAVGSAYGAAGSFVILLIWIYYSALISFYGAEFTQVYARQYGKRIRPEDHAVRIDPGKKETVRAEE